MHDTMECLQTGTQKLRVELEWMKAWRGQHPQTALVHLRQFHIQLSTCGDLIREAQSESASRELQSVICEYRECLQRIEEALPILQTQLLAQRSLLQRGQAHFRAASNWAHCSKNTI